MKYNRGEENGFLSLLGMLIALCIVCYLFFTVFKTYFKGPALEEEVVQETDSGRSIVAPKYKSIVENSRVKIDDYNKKVLQRQKQIENFDE